MTRRRAVLYCQLLRKLLNRCQGKNKDFYAYIPEKSLDSSLLHVCSSLAGTLSAKMYLRWQIKTSHDVASVATLHIWTQEYACVRTAIAPAWCPAYQQLCCGLDMAPAYCCCHLPPWKISPSQTVGSSTMRHFSFLWISGKLRMTRGGSCNSKV